MTALPSVVQLEGVARRYAWGSHTAIQQLLGIAPDGQPLAELWFGAHPDDPSPVIERGVALDELVSADPEGVLGRRVAQQFDGRLPFLVKILAAGTALSMQVHPSRAQAKAGFAAEDARGVPRDAPERNYRDANHKPELLCALEPFEALCGFRPPAETLEILGALAVPRLDEVRDLLAGPHGLRAAFTHLLTLVDPAPVVAAVVGRASDPVPPSGAVADALHAVRVLAADFPGDIGIVLSLLLNYVRLEPGEAIYLGAGTVHCYLRGTGVEVMANSDNVLRCALTPKHVDAAEVLAITDFTPLAEPRCPMDVDDQGGLARRYDTPVADFALSLIELRDAGNANTEVSVGGRFPPHLVLCVEGTATVSTPHGGVEIGPGFAAFVRAPDPDTQPFAIRGSGRVFVATVGQSPAS